LCEFSHPLEKPILINNVLQSGGKSAFDVDMAGGKVTRERREKRADSFLGNSLSSLIDSVETDLRPLEPLPNGEN
jgi:hypothetical protein